MCSSQWEFTRRVSGAAASPLNQPLDAVAIQACYAARVAPPTVGCHSHWCSTNMQTGQPSVREQQPESQPNRVSNRGQPCAQKRNESETVTEEEEERASQEEVTLPAAALRVLPPAGSGPVVSPGGVLLRQSGTNVTSGVPDPSQGRRGACLVPWAPGLRSDGGLVRHQAGHRGQGSLTLMVLLLRSFTGVPFVPCFNIVRRGNTLNGMKVETALEP